MFSMFLAEIATVSQTSCAKCGSYPFHKGKSSFEMRFLFPILDLGFLISRSGLLRSMDKKSEVFTFFGIRSTEQFLLEVTVVTNLNIISKLLVSIIFQVTVKYDFHGSYCTFSKCSLGLTQCRINMYALCFA